MELELKITCTCHQANIAICCQTPLVAPIAPEICFEGFSTCLIQICHQLCSLFTPSIQALRDLQSVIINPKT